MNCYRCNRVLKVPSLSGFGRVCERIVLGSKPARIKRGPRTADANTPDLFAEELRERAYMRRVSELIGSISLEVA